MKTYTHTPADVRAVSFWSPELLRDYRLKGYLEPYGEKGANGHWLYSGRDLVAFWVAEILHGRGKQLDLPVKGERPMDLKRLFEHSWIIAEFVAKHIAGRDAPVFWGHGDVRNEKGMSPHGETLSLNRPIRFKANTYEQIESLDLYAMDVVNTKALASFASSAVCKIVSGMNFEPEA
ncbi:hypothetical protein HOY34_04480 [Xinfangfangia sp. D13-10-4-6]|uniref:hypothetical protein n=1 Tax=Pseudogemmobacter hezensis TaxID=2737662 RepID=UPI001553BEFE|nr:hypothetical protein [Pseudogemmobacter hezensis]NPD14455.1 hypothetical protein [Pseudogemmobacter hezensis]